MASQQNCGHVLQDGVLRGISIQLGVMDGCKASQGANIFTDIAFEMGQGLLQLHDRHFYVSSAAGSVCQVLRPSQPSLCNAIIVQMRARADAGNNKYPDM